MLMVSKASDQAPVGSEYRVSLDHFAGPMDLLLHLIKKEEVDIHDIPISRILEQYMKHLEIIQDLDLDDAGDFLVMAATLMVVKSRMLLPAEEVDLGEEIDPRFELVQQLLEYKKIKDASAGLVSRSREFARRVGRPESARPEPLAPEDRFLDEVALFDLLEAFGRVMESIGTDAGKKDRRVRVDDIPVREYVSRLGERIRSERSLTFSKLLEDCRDRAEAVGYFLAILLLLKQGSIAAAQGGHCGDIRLFHRSDTAVSDVDVDLADDFR
jgi:segregation and condensation protein A